MVKILLSIFTVIGIFGVIFLGYWLGGGDFERGHSLGGIYGIAVILSSMCVGIFWSFNSDKS